MTTDRTPPAPAPAAIDERAQRQRALLRTQPWARLTKQLTAIALKRIRGRSVSDAHDYAQGAIADAYETLDRGGWDPDKGPLLGFLVSRVISTSNNERRRKRNACEVWLDEEEQDDAGRDIGLSRHEKHLGADAPAADEALHRLRFATTLHERLVLRLAADPLALQIIALMLEGLAAQGDIEAATVRSTSDVRDARRRIRYHAEEITKELSAGGARSNEVTQ